MGQPVISDNHKMGSNDYPNTFEFNIIRPTKDMNIFICKEITEQISKYIWTKEKPQIQKKILFVNHLI